MGNRNFRQLLQNQWRRDRMVCVGLDPDWDRIPSSLKTRDGGASESEAIAYDKWIREQVVEILGLPELYARLPRLFEVQRFESDELAGEAEELQRMLEAYVVP
jgi:hypothetical protein